MTMIAMMIVVMMKQIPRSLGGSQRFGLRRKWYIC